MRLGYKHEKDKIESNRYWNNTILPLLKNGSLEHAVEGTYAYPNRIGLYPGMTCQFFCTFCGRNYNAKYNSTDIAKSFEVFKQVIDQDPKEGEFWQDDSATVPTINIPAINLPASIPTIVLPDDVSGLFHVE